MSRKRIWDRKEYERQERKKAEREAKARRESESRRETIKVLDEQQIKQLLRSVRTLVEEEKIIDQIEELIELAGLQQREIKYLTTIGREWERIRAFYPDDLENLRMMAFRAEWEPLMAKLPPAPKNWEDKRRGYTRSDGVGLIEYEFGDAGEAYLREHSLSGGFGSLPYQPTCLDKIFAGGAVKMHKGEDPGLQDLFGMHRNRFPKDLSVNGNGRETWYDYHAVTEIIIALLSPETAKRKTPARGCPRRLWPKNPNLRTRILGGIAARIESLAMSETIARAFLRVVRQYLPDSAKK